MRKILFLTALLALMLTSTSWAADISGKWTITWWGAGAEESFPIDIKASGENLTITGTHPSFKEMTGTGTLKGDAVSINIKSASMEIALTGKLSGNKMSGTRKIGSSGDGRGSAAGGTPTGGQGGAPAGQSGAPGGAAPQGGMPGSTGGAQGGASAGQGGQGGAPADAQGGGAAQGNENWTAVKN